MRTVLYYAIAIIVALVTACDIVKSTQIEQAVVKALASDNRTSSFDFEISCDSDGVVTITGEIFTPGDIDIITEIAKSVEGVTSVNNKCHVPESSSGMMQDTVVNTPYL